jgi:hypothetical protein
MPNKFKQIWDKYLEERSDETSTQTFKYFKNISVMLKNSFLNSDKQIVHFGSSNSIYLQNLNMDRRIIGYDYAESSFSLTQDSRLIPRLVDLESIDNNKLTYNQMLENDLSVPSFVLMIRVLEYLTPQAVQLLIFAVISNLKSGSRVDIEILKVCQKDDPLNAIGLTHNMPKNYVASFFGPRTDIKFTHHEVTYNEEDDKSVESSRVERLVMEKI